MSVTESKEITKSILVHLNELKKDYIELSKSYQKQKKTEKALIVISGVSVGIAVFEAVIIAVMWGLK